MLHISYANEPNLHVWALSEKPWLIPGHQSEMSDSVKLFPRDAKDYRFEIDFFLKGIDWHFLCQNYMDLVQIFCLSHGFEVTSKFPPQNRFPIESQKF